MPGPKLRVFLDSNVVFSALHSPKGAPGIILEEFIRGNVSLIVSQQVLEEVIRITREKLPKALPALRTFLVNVPPEVVADPAANEIERWTDRLAMGDAAILAAAVTAQPDYFVTGDNHFLREIGIAEESGLNIVTPAQFLRLLEPGQIK